MQVLTGIELKRMLEAASRYLTADKERINALNVFPVPDGDTGTNMALTISAAVRELDGMEQLTVRSVSQAVARGSLMGARGNSGVILSQFFRGFSEGCGGAAEADGTCLAQAFRLASRTTYKAVMKPVEGTILTVAKAAAAGAEETAEEGHSPLEVWESALKAAKDALIRTPEILPVLRQAGVVDAGGEGLVVALQGALDAWKGEEKISEDVVADLPEPSDSAGAAGISAIEGDLVNKYCTEFLIKGEGFDVDALRSALEPKGDSTLVVGDERVIKVHIHTDHPGEVLELCAAVGDMVDIKIDNMRLQNDALMKEHPKPTESNVFNLPTMKEATEERKSLGLVAVVPGKGLADIFASLGVDRLVTGGQTMNPSTEELVRAVEEVNADNVIILPNNKNVIFSARQAKELVDKQVGVVATRSIPQGISALMSFDPDEELEDNVEAMEQSMRQVKTGEVTYAVRATKAGDLQIEEEDIIGLVEGKIAAAGRSIDEVTLDLLDSMVEDESSVISLYSGDNHSFANAEVLAETVRERYPDCEVELYQGNQPLYYYILSVE